MVLFISRKNNKDLFLSALLWIAMSAKKKLCSLKLKLTPPQKTEVVVQRSEFNLLFACYEYKGNSTIIFSIK